MTFKKGCIPWNKGQTGIYSKETLRKISESGKGRKHSEDSKKKISMALIGKKHSEESKRKMSENCNPWNTGKKHTMEHRKKQSDGIKNNLPNTVFKKGQRPWNWNGGITKLNKLIRSLPEYKLWRISVFERDNFTCQECGKNRCYVEAHHLKQFKIILEINGIKSILDARKCNELWDTENGQTLCPPCHNSTKNGRMKQSQ